MAGYSNNEQIDKYKDAFNLFDKDGDGVITVHEIGDVLRSLGTEPTLQEITKLLNQMDTNGNGTIEFSEFLSVMVNFHNNPKDITNEQIRDIFSVFDRNGDGFITEEEIMQLTTILGETLSDDDVKSMISEIDSDKDGKINLEEFSKIMCTKP